MKRLLLVVCLLSVPGALWAQQAQTGVNGLELIAPLKLAGGNDSNFLVDRGTPQQLTDQTFMVTLPKIAYRDDSRRHEFIFTWVPEFELFVHNSDQNAMNQQALAGFNYYLRRNIQVWLGDTFQTSKDPARALNNVFLLLPRTPYRENSLQGSVEYQPNSLTNISVQYDTAWTKFGLVDPLHTGILDTRAHGYSLSVSRMLNRRQRLSFRYSHFKITPTNRRDFDGGLPTNRPFESPVSSLGMEYRLRVNPTTSVGISAGAIKLNSGITYTFGGSLSKRLGSFSLGAHFLRGLTFQNQSPAGFTQGLASYGYYELLGVRLRGQLTRNTALQFDTGISHAAADWRVDSSRSLTSRLRFDYRVTDRKVLFASWETFHQARNAFVQAPLARNRIMMGLEISLSSDDDRRTSRLNEDAAYVALTDHAARRRALEED